MIDAEKLLGGLIRQGIRRSGRGRSGGLSSLLGSRGLSKGVVGMGALGIAFAAFEHFTQKHSNSSTESSSPARTIVPPSPPNQGPAVQRKPPPLPGVSRAGQKASPGSIGQAQAILLLRAMIAAANADGHIDDTEKDAILNKLEEAGLSEEERTFVLRELETPSSIDSLLPWVDSQELANQVYAVSLLAINVDTQAERDYLAYLKTRLALADDVIKELNDRFGGPAQS